MKILDNLMQLAVVMVLWAVGLITLGVAARINWELFMVGWSAL